MLPQEGAGDPQERAQGRPGARCTRSSLRNGFTAYFVLSLATGFFVTIISEKLASQKLDASIGASEPHDFAVRLSAVRQERLRVHRIPLHVRDDRETPLVWDGMATISR